MIDQVIWARAIVPFLVYDWSYILTFCLLFPPITERPCGVKRWGAIYTQGRCPGLRASGLSVRANCIVRLFFSLFFSENQNNCVTLEAVSMGESHRFSARFIYELQDLMEQTFKAMAEREGRGR